MISSCRSDKSPRPESQIPMIDRCPPRLGIASLWVRGRGKVRVGGHEDAQPLRLARAEPVYQVVKIVIVMGRSHVQHSTTARSQPPEPQRLTPGLRTSTAVAIR